MPQVPRRSPIDFLVMRKFGRLEHEDGALGLAASDYDRIARLNEQIAEYRAELSAKTVDEIRALQASEQNNQLAEALAKNEREERGRFFATPLAEADFIHWSKCAHWTLDEAIALSFGIRGHLPQSGH